MALTRSLRPKARPADLDTGGSSSPLAPQTSVRPRARPADLDTSSANSAAISELAPETSLRPRARPEGLGPQTPGIYPGLGIQDETARFGRLGRRARPGAPSEVTLHQTDTDTADQVRDAYDQRVRAGRSIGAHYLIDKDGSTSLTVPTDRAPSHVVGHNNASIGIENVGRHMEVDMGGDLHAQIEAMDLAPGLKAELLAKTPAQLKQTMRDNGGNIYGDITGPQKRANWNLLGALTEDHGLDMSTDVHAHEDQQAKVIGEGGNIEEMVDTMTAWPDKIAELRGLVDELAANPDTFPGQLDTFRELLADEERAQAAVDADGTVQEQNALEGERILGEGGPATSREETRTTFWDDFYGHMGRLDQAIASLQQGG